jgi:hypothetical protein
MPNAGRPASARASRKFDRLWGHGTGLSESALARVKMDRVATTGVTPARIANEMAKTIRKLPGITPDSAVLDGTACVGGETLALARVFRNVTSVEIDRGRAAMLTSNLAVFAGEGRPLSGMPTVLVGDCTTIWKELPPQDVVVLHPPWGGAGYKEKAMHSRTLCLSGMPLHRVCRMLSDNLRCKYVALNLPFNVHMKDFLRPDDGTPPVVHCDRLMENTRFVVLSYPM